MPPLTGIWAYKGLCTPLITMAQLSYCDRDWPENPKIFIPGSSRKCLPT